MERKKKKSNILLEKDFSAQIKFKVYRKHKVVN